MAKKILFIVVNVDAQIAAWKPKNINGVNILDKYELKEAWKTYDTCPLCGMIIKNWIEIDGDRSHITEISAEFLKDLADVDINKKIKEMLSD